MTAELLILFMAYVTATLEGSRENETDSKTGTTGGQRMEMMQVVSTTKAIRPDCPPFTCPALFGQIRPRLTYPGDRIAPSSLANRRMSIPRLPRDKMSQC